MAGERTRRTRLDQPRETRRQLLRAPAYDPEAFGRLSERIARFIGTGRFLVYMTVFVLVWVAWNSVDWALQFDPFPFIGLTLMLSLQASYAAPLILLAQNRQADRDRVQYEHDRKQTERSLADTEFLAREVASLRLAVGDVVTRDFFRSELREAVETLTAADGDRPATAAGAAGAAGAVAGAEYADGVRHTGGHDRGAQQR